MLANLFAFGLFLTLSEAQFSRSCRNLLKTECVQLYPDFVMEFDNLCECDLHPVKAPGQGHQLLTSTSSSSSIISTAPGIQCMRFSRTKVDRLFRCLAQPHALRSIDFYKDAWASLPDFANFTNLQVLRLRDLALHDLDPRAFFGLSRLKLLELSNNKFKALPNGLLDGVAGLEELVLHGNRLAKLERSQFAAGGTKLKRLTLSEMEFQAIPNNFFDIFPELEYLAIKRTFLSHVGSLGTLRYLRTLHLDQNRIKSIDPNAFTGLYNLRTLDLRRNWLRSFPGELLLNQGQLENLWLSDNIFICDCRLATLAQWLRNSLRVQSRKTKPLSLDPSSESCLIGFDHLRRTGTGARLACGPKCEGQVPAEFFADVNESDLICTTTSTSPRPTSKMTTTTMPQTTSTRPISGWPSLEPSGIESLIYLGGADPSSSESSTPFPLFALDKFSLVLWLVIVAACSLIVVVVVTIVVRYRNGRNRFPPARYRPAPAKVVTLANTNDRQSSPDSSASSTTSSSATGGSQASPICPQLGPQNINAKQSDEDESNKLSGDDENCNKNNGLKKSSAPHHQASSLGCCYPSMERRARSADASRNRHNNRAAKLKAKIAAVSRESSGLSVAERAANKSGATLGKGDWSPLFERVPSCHQVVPSIMKNGVTSSPLMLLAVDTQDGTGTGTGTGTINNQQIIQKKPFSINNSTFIERRRPISAAFGIESLLLPTSNRLARLNGNGGKISGTLYRQPASSTVSSGLMSQHHATPVQIQSATMTLNRSSLLTASNNNGTQTNAGAILYPAYKTLNNPKNSHNINNNNNTTMNTSVISSSTSTSASPDSSPTHNTVVPTAKSESLV